MDSVAAEAPLNAVGMGMSTGLKSGPIMQEEAVMAVPSRMARVMYWFGRIMAFCLFLNGFKGGFTLSVIHGLHGRGASGR